MIAAGAADLLGLAGRRVLITGGTRGVGAGLARRLAAHGAAVVLGYRADHDSAAATVAAIRAAGGTASAIAANLVEPLEVRRLVQEATGADGRDALDAVVHAAALGSFKPVVDLRPAQWDLTLNVGARAFLLLAQAARPVLAARRGRLIAISSLGGRQVVASYGALGIAKAALEALVRYLAVELAGDGIAVNGVALGAADAGSLGLHPAAERLLAEARDRALEGRLATADDLAGPVLFLLSPLADWVRGQVLVADGGATLRA